MFRKLLIANRGEIAVRIMRACRDLGISPVAVYSEADADALHVRLADEAYEIGPAPSVESYLRIDKILDAARESGAQAIHPGYGFLAENADFARAVRDAGLVFIGPTPEAMEAMGLKVSARRVAILAGAPVVPGTEPLASYEEALAAAQSLGYPVMLKASAGGGGKGMRFIATEEEMRSAFETAQSEAVAAFGNPEVYLEKAIERPRHIEIQVFADTHGNVVHLGERECSIQRRHQKVVEECPSPIADASSLRERMGHAAIEIARAVRYVGAGTVEFLVSDLSRDFYFLEMNTRLQVEHPVTEMVTGFDLVREQIMVASGAALSFTQQDVGWRGHAIECRVYAEDPDNNFLPSPGRINFLRTPTGPGVRDDGGVSQGAQISIYYDPMISKLTAWGRTRLEAIDRLRRALDEYSVDGIKTTLSFFRALVRDEEFLAARLDTGFIARFNERQAEALKQAQSEAQHTEAEGQNEEDFERDVALIIAALDYRQTQKQMSANHRAGVEEESRWRLAGRAALINSRS